MLDKIIQSSFIDRIARTHGDPPADRDWAGELALRLEVLQPTIDQLQHAADGLVVTIKSKSFPPFSTCLMAIRDAVSKPAAQPARQASGITAASYFDECKKWLNRFGPGYVVINRTRDAAAWETWIAYYRQIGLASNASLMSQPRDEWTVPTQYPDTFDRQAPAPMSDDEVARLRRTGKVRTQGELDRATKAMEDFKRDIPRRRDRERVQRQHIDAAAFDRWAEEVASQPLPSASPELASRIAQRSAA
jgi:hypothetical protein